ncbi:MAG: GNAT family N-acetyltransferase [Desulfobacteraceae bacterium]|nr:GNAT family N-acetyltransferase [Desulfobacteraceae bacterium]
MFDDSNAQIKIEIVKSASKEELIALYKDAGWWKAEYEKDLSFLNAIVENSAFFAGAFYNKTLIGMGRALSDMASDAYIQDVAVLSKYRNKGVGEKIVKRLIEELKKMGVDWIGLIGKPGTASFYEKIGFKALEGHYPFKYEG